MFFLFMAVFISISCREFDQYNNNNYYYYSKLGRKLADQSGDDREISFLFQRRSVLIQRYNAILLHDCFVKEEEE